jgi:putative phage-type endonuclease
MITKQQLDERKGYLGGSDMPIIMGLSKFMTPYQLYLQKLGLLEQSQEENEYQYWGNIMEPIIRSEFERRNSVSVYETCKTHVHPLFEFVQGHFDGEIDDYKSIFEAKTCSAFASQEWGEEDTAQVPIQYIIQVATYCSIKNWPSAHIAVLIGGNTYKQYKYTRDLDLESRILDSACSFWDAVESKESDNIKLINIDDLKLRYTKHIQGKSAQVNEIILEKLSKMNDVKSKLKELKEIEEQSKFEIMEYMKDCESIIDESEKVLCTWKTNKSGNRTFLLK